MKIILSGKVRGDRFVNETAFRADLSTFDGLEVIVTIEKKTKKRTVSQNSYLHVLLRLFADELNKLGNDFTMLQVKDMMKFKFLTVEVFDKETGEVIGQRVRDTSELTTTELTWFIERVVQYAADMFHFNLPMPNEQMNISFC